jgi:hypothetical protein
VIIAAQTAREVELRPLAHDHSGALAACVSRRQKKNTAHPSETECPATG